MPIVYQLAVELLVQFIVSVSEIIPGGAWMKVAFWAALLLLLATIARWRTPSFTNASPYVLAVRNLQRRGGLPRDSNARAPGMKVTAAGIDRIKIGNADASGHGAHFVVWLYLQVDEGGTHTAQELVVSVPYDSRMTFDDIATQAFEKGTAILRACCEIDESMWWKQFNRSLAPLPEWTAGPQ